MKVNRALALALLPILLLAVGCGPSAEQKLIGRWEGKIELSDSAMAAAPDNPLAAMAGSAMKTMVANLRMKYQFNADKTFEAELPNPLGTMKASGNWEVISHSGDKITLQLNPSQGASMERTVTFTDADHFETSDDNGVILFTRQVE